MCGIFICEEGSSAGSIPEVVSRRGPSHQISLTSDGLFFAASVLHMRGDFCPQPLTSERYVFAFNGEVFGPLSDYDPQTDNDALYVFQKICKGIPVQETFSNLEGPFAFALYDKITKVLYFGRDCIGRRSLLYRHSPFTLTSVVPFHLSTGEWIETGAGLVYSYDTRLKTIITFFTLNHPSQKFFKELNSFNTLLDLLEESVRRRIHFLHSFNHPANILFSGGVDSLLLACILHRVLPPQFPIILVNVSFQNKRIGSTFENAPDRIIGRSAYNCLQRTLHSRNWIFKAIDVSVKEYYSHCPRIYELSFPQISMRDLSIAAPLWFASKAVAKEHRIVFLGMGADELLGGYSRHRRAYEIGGWQIMAAEVQMDIMRIGTRNLGRDDRIISDHGLEARFPFLDESVVHFLGNLPIQEKYDPSLPAGKGDKLPFRKLLIHLGIENDLAYTPKRAIQFGSKSAKMNSSKESGDDMCTLEMFLNNINP